MDLKPENEIGMLDLKSMPKSPCIYMLISKGKLVYVGQTTKHWLSRLGQHIKNKTFDAVQIHPCPASKLNVVEAELVIKHKPKYNKQLPYSDKYVSKDALRDIFNISGFERNRILEQNEEIEVFPFAYDAEKFELELEKNNAE